MNKTKNNIFTYSTLGLLTLSSSALAQQVGSTNTEQELNSKKNVGLETIVVTSTRKETNLQATPIAVTALSAAAISNRNIADIQDVSRFTPSLSVGTRTSTGGAVSIRGMGVDALESAAAVGTYIDDVYFASSIGNVLGFMDVERVEVMRGPQGTLFGRNTIAGAIQYVSKAPDDEFGGYAHLTLGNYGRQNFAGAINLPVSETFALRIAARNDNVDGFVYDEFNDLDRGAVESTAARVRALWTPNDDLNVNLKVEHVSQENNGRAFLVGSVNPNAQFVGLAASPMFGPFAETRPLDDSYISSNFNPGDFSSAGVNDSEFGEFEFTSFMANVEYFISTDLTFKSITSFTTYENKVDYDIDGTPLSIISVVGADDENDVLTQEFQLSGNMSDAFSYTVGAYYYNSEQTLIGAANKFANAPAAPGGDPLVDTTSYSLYGQGSYQINDQLKATLGYRYTKEKIETYLINETEPLDFEFSDTSPYLGLDYTIDKNRMLYAKVSKGFRAGGSTVNRGLVGGSINFEPETAWTYEIGARLDLLDGQLRLNPTIFKTDWEDIQFLRIVAPTGAPVAITDNAGDGEIQGLEIDAEYAATEELTFRAALSLLDAEYSRVDFIPAPDGQANVDLDTPFQRAPEKKYTFGARYTFLLANDAFVVANLDYSWVDDQRSGAVRLGSVDMPSYGLLSGRLQYESPNELWSVALYGNNLTNEYYLNGGQDYAAGFTAGAETLFPGRPREYGVEVKFNF